MTRDEAERYIELIFDYHFIYSKERDDLLPFEGNLKDSVYEVKNRLETLLENIYNDFNESQEGLRYAYEETITGLTSQGEEDYA